MYPSMLHVAIARDQYLARLIQFIVIHNPVPITVHLSNSGNDLARLKFCTGNTFWEFLIRLDFLRSRFIKFSSKIPLTLFFILLFLPSSSNSMITINVVVNRPINLSSNKPSKFEKWLATGYSEALAVDEILLRDNLD